MRTITIFAAALALAATITASAMAADPLLPFPSAKAGPVFIASHTITSEGALASWFQPGAKVEFRAFAIDRKTKKLVQAKDVKFFYVTIPNQPNVKLKYDAAVTTMKNMPWSGTWTVPATFPVGQVSFRILIKLKAKRTGEFVQMPVATSQLNIATNAQPVFGPAPTGQAVSPITGKPVDMGLYVDSVNGTRPTGAAPRLVGCSQTNVFKRGEQFVLRSWGMVLKTGEVLSNDNVKEAHFSIAGQPDTVLNWGAHGATGAKVFFWTNAWNIPKDFPLGTTTVHVVYTLETGVVGTYDYDINIIP
jgi:hypothetical protein